MLISHFQGDGGPPLSSSLRRQHSYENLPPHLGPRRVSLQDYANAPYANLPSAHHTNMPSSSSASANLPSSSSASAVPGGGLGLGLGLAAAGVSGLGVGRRSKSLYPLPTSSSSPSDVNPFLQTSGLRGDELHHMTHGHSSTDIYKQLITPLTLGHAPLTLGHSPHGHSGHGHTHTHTATDACTHTHAAHTHPAPGHAHHAVSQSPWTVVTSGTGGCHVGVRGVLPGTCDAIRRRRHAHAHDGGPVPEPGTRPKGHERRWRTTTIQENAKH